MGGLWAQIGHAEDAATVATGLATAGYFTGRAYRTAGPRRLAALVLAALCGGSAGEALALSLATAEAAPPAAVLVTLRLPLLLGNVVACWLVALGIRS